MLKVNTSVEWVCVPSGSIIDVSYPTSPNRRGRIQGGGGFVRH